MHRPDREPPGRGPDPETITLVIVATGAAFRMARSVWLRVLDRRDIKDAVESGMAYIDVSHGGGRRTIFRREIPADASDIERALLEEGAEPVEPDPDDPDEPDATSPADDG